MEEDGRIIDVTFKSNGRRRLECPDGYIEYNDDWFIGADGTMRNAWSGYEIDGDRLSEDDWILHCMTKRWFDANTFLPAYFEACRTIGLKVVPMRISYS